MDEVHIETDEDDAPTPELNCEIYCVKPAVSTPSDLAPALEKHVMHASATDDPVHVGEVTRRAPILSDLEAVKVWGAFVDAPPRRVARIEHVGPRRDGVRVVDGDDA